MSIRMAIALFCAPINILLFAYGIDIEDYEVVLLAVISMLLAAMPAAYEYYDEKKKEKPDD